MKTRTVGTTGVENRMDLNFLQAGKTTRDEVATKLAWIDIGLSHQRLFWGKWYGSSIGVGTLFGPAEIPIPTGTRRWKVHNLLVEFDEKGVVERTGQFSYSKLNEELERWLKEVGDPPLNLSAPIVIKTESGSSSMTLSDDLLQFVDWNGETLSVPRKDITRLGIQNDWFPGDSSMFGPTPPPKDLFVVFGFRHEKNGNCKCMVVKVYPADYLMLLRYVPQAATHR